MTNTPAENRGKRKDRVGRVVSDKMVKTIVVVVERRVRHPVYEKVITRVRRFYAHDEKGEARVGDRVRIVETRPLSRLKRWRLMEVLERGTEKPVTGVETEAVGEVKA
ncbi:MAG: 30S ribosomal protein S17 [Verrucomicrobiae bacterium]|nr:30S ribosomal protein S17 [Verrucomicrobiae bacterium]